MCLVNFKFQIKRTTKHTTWRHWESTGLTSVWEHAVDATLFGQKYVYLDSWALNFFRLW